MARKKEKNVHLYIIVSGVNLFTNFQENSWAMNLWKEGELLKKVLNILQARWMVQLETRLSSCAMLQPSWIYDFPDDGRSKDCKNELDRVFMGGSVWAGDENTCKKVASEKHQQDTLEERQSSGLSGVWM